LQEPEQVRQSRLIREAQQAAAESGIDPVSEPERFLEVVDPIVEGDPLLRSGIRAQIVRLQRELATEPQKRVVRVVGGTEQANQYADQFPNLSLSSLSEGQSATINLEGNRPTGIDVETADRPETFTTLTAEEKQAAGIDPTEFAQRNNLTRRIHTAGGQTINVGDESNPAFDALTDQFKNDLTQASEAATQATGLLQEVNRATDLLSQGNFSTGAVRPVLTGLRGIAEDLGVSIDPALREAGVENLGEVSDAESFRAFSSNLTTRIAGRLPSNLNQSEINLILDASSQLGKTPEANASALAAFKASAELTQRNASRLTEAAAEGTQELIAEQRRQREKGTEEFEALAERYKEEILEQRSGAASDTSQGDGRLRYNPETGRVE